MEDIEDLFKFEAEDNQRKQRTKVTTNKKVKPVKEVKPTIEPKPMQYVKADGDLPGRAKVFVKTYGCSHNISDSEYMEGLLADYGYTLVNSVDEADACLLNSCTVKNPS